MQKKIIKGLNNTIYVLSFSNDIWSYKINDDNSFSAGTIHENVKDFIIDKWNNLFILNQNNEIFYKKQGNDNFIKVNIFKKGEQIEFLSYNKDSGILFFTNKEYILINNDQINELLNDNVTCEIQYPLIRIPRVPNYNQIPKTANLNISNDDLGETNFQNRIQEIRNSLLIYGIINPSSRSNSDHQIYHLTNTTRHPYFIISVTLENGNTIELVFRSSNLYFQGFINYPDGQGLQGHYYHFHSTNDDTVLETILEGANNNK